MNVKHKIYIPAIVLIIAISTLFAGISTVFGADNDNLPEQKGLQQIAAEQYSKRFEISVEEALNRLELMDSFPELENELTINEPKTFGGLWIQHEPEFKIVVAFTSNGEEKINKYIPEGLPSYFEIRTVDATQAALEREQNTLISNLHNLGIPSCSLIDIKNNRIRIDIGKADKSKFENVIQDEKLALPPKAHVNFVEGLPELASTIYGGLVQSDGTAGFAVEDAYGTRGIVTAGHLYNYIVITSEEDHAVDMGNCVDEAFGGSYDVQWHIPQTSVTINNKIRYLSSGGLHFSMPVEATRGRTYQRVGDIVFKFGRTTGQTCGEIISKDATVNEDLDEPTFIVVENIFDFPAIVEIHDSGGPWFTDYGEDAATALGITVAVSPDRDYAYYMPIDYIGHLDIYVLTSP